MKIPHLVTIAAVSLLVTLSALAQTNTPQDPRNMSKAQIQQVQQTLTEFGYSPGNVDGVWTPESCPGPDAIPGEQVFADDQRDDGSNDRFGTASQDVTGRTLPGFEGRNSLPMVTFLDDQRLHLARIEGGIHQLATFFFPAASSRVR